MKQKLLKQIGIGAILFTTSLSATQNSNGFYLGLDTAFINMGDDTLDIRVQDNNAKIKNKKEYADVTSITYGYKIGYQHFD